MNHNFATVDENNHIVYAPDTLGASLRAPKDWQYHAANYWELDKTIPTAPEGKLARQVKSDGFEIGDLVTIQEEHVPSVNETGEPLDPNDEYKPLVKVVRQRYEFVPIPEEVKPPRVFNKYRLGIAIESAGLLPALLQFFSANPSFKFHWDNAQEFAEDDERFLAFKAEMGKRFGEEAVDAILGEAVAR